MSPPFILLIEDNQVAHRMEEAIALGTSCRYLTATNGEQALELVKNNHLNLIITDVGLPGMSGKELTRHIRDWEISNHKNPIPIIGLTTRNQEKTKKTCLLSGMTQVFTKPIDEATMKEIIAQCVTAQHQTTLNSGKATQTKEDSPLGPDLPKKEHQLFELEQFPLLDIDNAIQKIGSEDLLDELLQLMLDQALPDDTFAITDAYEAHNWALVEKLAHKIKGGAVYCGTIKLQYACQYLERYRKAGHSLSLEALYRQLIMVIEETKHQIQSWLTR